MSKMITVTEVTSAEEFEKKLINSDLILKIEDTNEDSYGKSIIFFQGDPLEIHTNQTLEELKNLINNG